FDVIVTNGGPLAASSVVASLPIPAGTTFSSLAQLAGPAFTLHAPPVGGTGTATATLGSFAAPASASFRMVVPVQPATTPGGARPTATVTSATLETNTADDTATATAKVTHPTPVVTALPLDAFAMTPLTGVPVASVEYASGAVPAGLLGATIDWGDGT